MDNEEKIAVGSLMIVVLILIGAAYYFTYNPCKVAKVIIYDMECVEYNKNCKPNQP